MVNGILFSGQLYSTLNFSMYSTWECITLSLLLCRLEIVSFAHVITSVNLLYLPNVPVVYMVTSVSTPALATCCMVKSAVLSVHVVLMVIVHQSMDHVTAIQDISDQPAVQVCHVYMHKCTTLTSLFTAHQLITYVISLNCCH